MAAINRIPYSAQSDMKLTDKTGIENSASPDTPFSVVLGDFEQLLLSLSSDSKEGLQTDLEGANVEELPEWTQEQWQEISALLTSLLQQANPVLEPTVSEAQKLDGQSLQGWESLLKQGKDPSLSLANVLPILHKMKQQGLEIPQDVADQFSKVMDNLGQDLSPIHLRGLMTMESGISSSNSNYLPLERGIVILPSQQGQVAQSLSTDGLETGAELEWKASNPVSEVVSPILDSPLQRISFQPIKPEVVPIQKENFLQEMTGFLLSKIKVSPLSNGTEARVSLYPEHLGQVDVKISLQQGQMMAQFVAETNMGKDLLESNLAGLRSALQQQGIQVTKIEVQTAAEAGLFNQQQQSQHQSGTNQQHQNAKRPSPMARVERVNIEELNTAYDYMQEEMVSRGHSEKSIDFTA